MQQVIDDQRAQLSVKDELVVKQKDEVCLCGGQVCKGEEFKDGGHVGGVAKIGIIIVMFAYYHMCAPTFCNTRYSSIP